MSLILAVMNKYFPHWEAPEDWGGTWIQCECPAHDDDNPSASVSYELGAFTCHACGYSGDCIKIIEQEEECGFAEAQRIAARIAEESGNTLPSSLIRKRSRGVPRPARFGSREGF